MNKLKNVPVTLKKLSDVVSNEVVKNTKFNKLNTKVDNLENKSPNVSTLPQTTQSNTDKHNLEVLIKKLSCVSGFREYYCS